MKRKTIVDLAEFRRRVARGHKPGVAVRFVADGNASVIEESRTVTFVFSDASVDRYGDTIDVRGWMLDNYKANPVVLFGHDSGSVENVIGRAHNVRVDGTRLIGDIEFMEASVNPVAEAVYQMVKGGFLKTVSVGFSPLEWAASKDKSRPGGIDFKKQELLEVSIVPIPANPNALQQAKAAGIDVDRLALREAAMAVPSKKGLYEVSWLADLLNSLGYLHDCVAWEAEYEGDGSEVPQALADALRSLGAVLVSMTAEEVAELLSGEDGVLVSDDAVELALTPAQKALRGFVFNRRKWPPGLQTASTPEREVRDMLADELKVLFRESMPALLPGLTQRAGKVLSAANEKTLRDAHASITAGCEMIMGLVSANEGSGDAEPDADETKARQARERRARVARAHQLQQLAG